MAFIGIGLCFCNQVSAQCGAGVTQVAIQTTTDGYGYEGYWELLPTANSCGNGTIDSGGNVTQIGCSNGGTHVATSGNGYANNQTFTSANHCLTTGGSYKIHYVDDYHDGGFDFTVLINGFPVYHFVGLGMPDDFIFTVKPPLAYDMGVTKITTNPYANPGMVPISGNLFNYSSNAITSLDINYTVNGGTIVTQNISGLSIAPFTAYNFSHPTLWHPTANGNYTISAWASNLNGNADMDTTNDKGTKIIVVGDTIPNKIDWYLTWNAVPSFTTIADVTNSIYAPRDLDFHPILSNYELWVVLKSTVASGGKTVTLTNAGKPLQTSQLKQDGNAWHFMSLPTAIAFGDNGDFGVSPGILDANHGSGHYTGPALFDSSPLIYAQPSGGNGSHIDMLHQSPYSMGIAHDHDIAYWVYDDYHHNIMYYDFVTPHQPGGSDHSAGKIKQYTDFSLSRIDDNISSHLVVDKPNHMLYVVDNGNGRVIRMDTHTGSITGTYVPYAEPIAEGDIVTGTTWDDYINTGLTQPSGIDVIGNRLIVSDYSNGDIVIYNTAGSTGVELGRIHTHEPGIMGVKIGPDGKIYYVNETLNKVVRIDGFSMPTAIENIQESLLVGIAPNPSNGRMTITMPTYSGGLVEIKVLDLLGKVIAQTISQSESIQLDLSYVAKGAYFINLVNGDKTVNRKVVLQ